MEMYAEVATISPANRNNFMKVSDLLSVQQMCQLNNNEMYRSVYYYDEQIIEHMKKHKTVRNYPGKYYLPYIVIDVDKGNNTDSHTMQKTKEYLQEVRKLGVDDNSIIVWFSGRGYHIVFPDVFHFEPSNDLPGEAKETIGKTFPGCDTSIYIKTGLIRMGNTVNSKSGLFKIPFTVTEFFGLNHYQVSDMAKTNSTRNIHNNLKSDLDLSHLKVKPLAKFNELVASKPVFEPTRIVSCIQKMYSDEPKEGSRHEKIIRMTSTFIRAGVPQSAITAAIKSWAYNMEPDEVAFTVDNICKKGYKFGCNDKVMASYCDPRCIFHKKKNLIPEIFDSSAAEQQFVNFVRNHKQDRTFNMNEIWPEFPSYEVAPEDYIVFMGDTGLNKTAFMQNICIKLPRMKITYLTLEFSMSLLYRRFIQIAHGMHKDQVIEYYKNHNNHLSEALSHIDIMQVSPTLSELERIICKENRDMYVIDTTDCIELPNCKSEIEHSAVIAKELNRIAKERKVIICGIHHIAKPPREKSGSRQTSIDVHSVKGSSNAEQKADKVIGISGIRESNYRTVESLKARDDNPFKVQMYVDFNTFQIRMYREQSS